MFTTNQTHNLGQASLDSATPVKVAKSKLEAKDPEEHQIIEGYEGECEKCESQKPQKVCSICGE